MLPVLESCRKTTGHGRETAANARGTDQQELETARQVGSLSSPPMFVKQSSSSNNNSSRTTGTIVSMPPALHIP